MTPLKKAPHFSEVPWIVLFTISTSIINKRYGGRTFICSNPLTQIALVKNDRISTVIFGNDCLRQNECL